MSVFTYFYIIKGKAELKKANKQDLSIPPPQIYIIKLNQEKGMIEDEMVGWHHRLNGREFG